MSSEAKSKPQTGETVGKLAAVAKTGSSYISVENSSHFLIAHIPKLIVAKKSPQWCVKQVSFTDY